MPDIYRAILFRRIDGLQPDSLMQLFCDPRSHDTSQYIFTMAPLQTSRRDRVKTFVSKYVFDLLWTKHIYNRVDIMERFYNLLRANAATAPAAGWIFEYRMHQLLTRGRTVELFRVRGDFARTNFRYENYSASEEGRDPMILQLAGSGEAPSTEGHHLKENYYHCPKSTNFPTVDSVVLFCPPGELPPTLLMFQITWVRGERSINRDGLRRIRDLAPGIRSLYVVVTPESIHPAIVVPASYFSDIQGQQDRMLIDGAVDEQQKAMSPDEVLPIFHYPVRMEELFAPSQV